ncbi:MAG: TolC family protein [Chloroflexi bacterium]|nr:TolC family protein [Chloroflexota bacterium]
MPLAPHMRHPRCPHRRFLWLLLAAALSAAVMGRADSIHAQNAPDTLRLSLVDARALALRGHPDLTAARLETLAARGALSQARTYPFNPQVEVEGGTEERLGERRDYLVAIEQEIEWAGQRGLRIDAAESGLRAAEFTVADAERLTLTTVSIEYLTALVAERQLLLARQVLGLNQQLFDAARSRFDAGDISGLELNLARIEVGRARTRLITAERDAAVALLTLRRGLGLPAKTPIVLVDEGIAAPRPRSLDGDSLLALALTRRPDLAALEREAGRLAAEARLARRAAVPNPILRAVREAEDGQPPSLDIGLVLPFPLFNRNRGAAAQLDALAEQVRLRRVALESRVRVEIGQALTSYAAAAEATAVFERDVLAQARENQALLEEGFEAGKFGLAEVLLIRNQLIESELEYWASWLARGAALVELEAATGTLVPDRSPIPTERE